MNAPNGFDLDSYKQQIQQVSNRDLVQKVADAVMKAAVMSGRRSDDGVDDAKCGALYSEAVRRGNVDLYNRGHNDACESQGHSAMCAKITTAIDVGDPTLANGEPVSDTHIASSSRNPLPALRT